MKTLVTGGAGFIGAHIVKTLVKRGDDVTLIDNFSTGSRDRLVPEARLVEGDIRDRDLLGKLFAEGGFEAVFHTAALARIQPSIKDPVTTHDVNVTGTLNILRAAAQNGVRRVVYSGSSSVYGKQDSLPFVETMAANPQNPYAMQKWMGEELCRMFSNVYGLDTACPRYFNVYGTGMIENGAYCTVLSVFLGQVRRGEKLTVVGDGSQRRDFTHVSDIVTGNLAAADAPGKIAGEPFNLGYGNNVSVREVAEKILAAKGRSWDKDVEFLPARPNEAAATLADNSKARRMFNWVPRTGFDQGLAELL